MQIEGWSFMVDEGRRSTRCALIVCGSSVYAKRKLSFEMA